MSGVDTLRGSIVGLARGLGLVVLEWNSLSGRIAGMYSTIADSSAPFSSVHGGSDAVSTLGSVTLGIGLYLSFLGTGLKVLGAVLWFVGRPREGIAPQA
jgi:hypothetical protein